MPTFAETLMEEARCLGCNSGASQETMMLLALLQRIAEAGGGGGGGTPSLPLNSVQFNDAGAFGGDADLTWNKTTNTLALIGAANNTQLALTGYSLTGANAQPALSIAGVWNTTGTPAALTMSITDTASNAASLFASFFAGAAGATEILRIHKTGGIHTLNGVSISGAFTTGPPAIGQFTLYGGAGGTQKFAATTAAVDLASTSLLDWSSTTSSQGAKDIGLARNTAGVLEVNSGVVGTFRDLELRTIITNNAAAIVRSDVAMTSGPGAALGTLTDAPSAGNADVWCPISLNGTTYWFPCWSL